MINNEQRTKIGCTVQTFGCSNYKHEHLCNLYETDCEYAKYLDLDNCKWAIVQIKQIHARATSQVGIMESCITEPCFIIKETHDTLPEARENKKSAYNDGNHLVIQVWE